jgi:hypothetical protein
VRRDIKRSGLAIGAYLRSDVLTQLDSCNSNSPGS